MSADNMMEDGVEQTPKKSNGGKTIIGILIAAVVVVGIVLWIWVRYNTGASINRYSTVLKSYYTAMIDSDTNALAAVTANDFADQTSIELKKGTKLSLFVYTVTEIPGANDDVGTREILFSITVLNEKPAMSYLNTAIVDKWNDDALELMMISNIAVGTDIMSE